MPKAYVIFTEDINDPAGMQAYQKASAPSVAQSGAVVLAVDGKPEVLEGEWHGQRTVLLEFESAQAAHAWYDSDAYQQAAGLRQAAAQTNAVIIAGFERPSGENGGR
jgi:uncharacterized protein (DUF1330 family)